MRRHGKAGGSGWNIPPFSVFCSIWNRAVENESHRSSPNEEVTDVRLLLMLAAASWAMIYLALSLANSFW
jgi:hypothetical protein